MKLLLTNDDGIDAPGLAALRRAVEGLGEPFTLAPSEQLSGCSHRVTTKEPLRFIERAQDCFVVDGTPADCVRAGLHALVPDAAWVLAGINAGGNLGADVYLSGTVAAAREAVLDGVPGIAVSHYLKRNQPVDWDMAVTWVRPILAELFRQASSPGVFWNINLPHLPPGSPSPQVEYCHLDPHPMPIKWRREGGLLYNEGVYHDRMRQAGSDVDVCFCGRIAVTRLSLHCDETQSRKTSDLAK
jgi:5'-nucleotidase